MTDRFNWRDAILAAGTLALLGLFTVAVETLVILRHLDQDRLAARQSFSGTTELVRHRLDRAVYFLDRATGKMGDIEESLKEEAASREKYDAKATALLDQTQADLEKFGQATDQLNALLASTNGQLNGQLLPAVTKEVNALNEVTVSLAEDARRLGIAVADADRAVSNPDIPASLSQVRQTTENVQKTTGDVYALVDGYLKNLQKPRNRLWGFVKVLVWGGSSAGQISTLGK